MPRTWRSRAAWRAPTRPSRSSRRITPRGSALSRQEVLDEDSTRSSAPRGDPGAILTVSPRDYDAVLFDLDGVLTRTASVHAAAWKKLFETFLEIRVAEMDEPFVPFDIDADYRPYVDGKPRYEGVAAFLAARSTELPAGTPEDGPGLQTVHALGTLKDQYLMAAIVSFGRGRRSGLLLHTNTAGIGRIATA